MQLEEGKFYRARDGSKIGPMSFIGSVHPSDHWPWTAYSPERKEYWRHNGLLHNEATPSPYDLLEEWIEPKTLSTNLIDHRPRKLDL